MEEDSLFSTRNYKIDTNWSKTLFCSQTTSFLHLSLKITICIKPERNQTFTDRAGEAESAYESLGATTELDVAPGGSASQCLCKLWQSAEGRGGRVVKTSKERPPPFSGSTSDLTLHASIPHDAKPSGAPDNPSES